MKPKEAKIWLMQKAKKKWGVKLSPYRTFDGKRYRLMGAGVEKGLGDYPRKPYHSFRTITYKGKKGINVYATYLYGKE